MMNLNRSDGRVLTEMPAMELGGTRMIVVVRMLVLYQAIGVLIVMVVMIKPALVLVLVISNTVQWWGKWWRLGSDEGFAEKGFAFLCRW